MHSLVSVFLVSLSLRASAASGEDILHILLVEAENTRHAATFLAFGWLSPKAKYGSAEEATGIWRSCVVIAQEYKRTRRGE